MQSFDTKDSNTLESFDRKVESFDTFCTKDLEVNSRIMTSSKVSIESLKSLMRKLFQI